MKTTCKNLKNLALLSLWMAKVGRQITSALSVSGEVSKMQKNLFKRIPSIDELITDMDDYIEFYNYRRFH
jgi:hypothetical protein